MRKTAIIILNWNGIALLQQFLPTLLLNSKGANRQVIVADNGSTDQSVEWLTNNHPEVTRIVLGENYGFAEGYNKAIEQTEADYVVLLNNDVEVTPNWLDSLEQMLDQDETIAACGPKILDFKNRTAFEYAGAAGGFIDIYAYPFCRGRIFTTLEKDNGQYNNTLDVMWVSGAAMMVRKNIYTKVGGLDAKFFAHQEEVDLCWRLKNFNYRVVCEPKSSVYHVGGASLSVGSPRKTYLNFRNSLLLLYKNLPDNAHRRSYAVRILLDSIAAIKFLFTDSIKHTFAVFRAHRDFHRLLPHYKSIRKDLLLSYKKWNHAELYEKSLVIAFYFHKKHIFSSLTNFKR